VIKTVADLSLNSFTALLRHGECEGGQCYLGCSDLALTKKGWQQMQHSLTRVNPSWQRIISSPLIRCANFATDMAQRQQLPIYFERNLQELNFGDWDGQAIERVWQDQREAVIAWGNNPVSSPPPQGEAADEFYERVTHACLSRIQVVLDKGEYFFRLQAHNLNHENK